MPVTTDQLRALNPFAVEYRYDDELIPQTTRALIAGTLNAVMDWAEQIIGA
ncbi:MAG: hypothetical protein AB1544_04340 [Pseudomonadota bacterium]